MKIFVIVFSLEAIVGRGCARPRKTRIECLVPIHMRRQTKAISSDSALPWVPIVKCPTVRIDRVRMVPRRPPSALLGSICRNLCFTLRVIRAICKGKLFLDDHILPWLSSSVYITDRIRDKSERTPRSSTCCLLIGKSNAAFIDDLRA